MPPDLGGGRRPDARRRVHQVGRSRSATARSPLGEPSSSTASTGTPAQLGGQAGRVADGGAGEAERRLGAVVEAHPPEPVEQVGDVAAEDAPQGVQLVDDDVAQPHEERRPAVVVGEDPGVEHLGVGQHHVGRPPEGRPLLRRRVAVVGHRPHPRDQPRPERAQLVVGQGLGREQQEGGVLPAGEDRLGDGRLVAERLARPGAGGQGDAPAGPEQVDGLRLVDVEAIGPPGRQPLEHLGVEGLSRSRRTGPDGPGGRRGASADPRSRGRRPARPGPRSHPRRSRGY